MLTRKRAIDAAGPLCSLSSVGLVLLEQSIERSEGARARGGRERERGGKKKKKKKKERCRTP